jgi:hypothetical protein
MNARRNGHALYLYLIYWVIRHDTLAEWLRRVIRNHLTYCRVGSSPACVD